MPVASPEVGPGFSGPSQTKERDDSTAFHDFMAEHPELHDLRQETPSAEESQTETQSESPDQGDASKEQTERHVDEEPIRIVLTSFDKNVDAFAREAAHEKLSKNPEGPLWKKMVKGAWNNLTHESRVVKATQNAREEILQSGNLLHHHDKSDKKWQEATVRRYGSEYGEALMREGETFHKLHSPESEEDPKAQRIKGDVLHILRESAAGNVTDDESRTMMLDQAAKKWAEEGISQEYIGEALLLASNINAIDKQVKAAIEARAGDEELDRLALADEILSKAEIVRAKLRLAPMSRSKRQCRSA